MSALLLCRESEANRLARLLSGAREGRSGVLVLRGEPGIGKSALLDDAVRSADGFRVLRARGVEAETDIAFAGLQELLRPILRLLNDLPERQRAVLKGALALGPAVAGDPLAVRAATLSLLAATAEEGPLLVVVDDAQWLDQGSAEALVFAGRRLEAEGIVLLFAAREDGPEEFRTPGLDELQVRGLDREAVGQLMRSCVAGPVAPSVVEQLTNETAGNPLAVIELCDLLSPAQLLGEQPLGEPLAAGDTARRAFVRRAQALSQCAQQALLVAAAAGDGSLALVAAAFEVIGVGVESLGEAEAADLLRVDDGRFMFSHPVVRSAVYAAAEPDERRAVHRALATALGERSPDRRAWHLAAAALGPDEEVAAALEQAADTARRRSGYAAAAHALERAAQLSPADGRRAARLLAGAEMARQAGRSEQALGLLRQASEEATAPLVRADVNYKRARLEWFRGRAGQAERHYLDAARLLESAIPAQSALVLVEASLAAQDAGDAAGALAAAERARAAAGSLDRTGGIVDDLARLAAEATVGVALYWAGEAAEAHRMLSLTISRLEDRHLAVVEPAEVLTTADWRAWTGTGVQQGRLRVEELLHEVRDTSALGLIPYTLHVAFHFHVRDGQWARACAAADEGARVAAETGGIHERHQLLALLALIEAAQGREEQCREHVDQAEALIDGGELTRPPELDEALGLLALGGGRPQEALHHLEAATSARGETANARRLARPSLGDLVESYILATGTVPLELIGAVTKAGEGDFDGTAAIAERCRAIVADEPQFDAQFVRALELHGSAWPFARARTQLCYGERLRRAGRRTDARVQLSAALDTFERLGAQPWAERAATELRATGQRVARRDPTAPEQLTPQELRVALIIADGATVQEAASQLVLSPKTIEAHLGRAYRKLGVRNRAQLATILARERPIRG